ncbi:MAG: rhamnulokinase, partial [Muribaculaceae bacterium]|nr:rhamnulokinase [Muribaculaceae bacterium]
EKSAFDGIIDVDDPMFVTPGGMEEKIIFYLLDNGYVAPTSQGDMVRCVLRSLAERYRKGVEQLGFLRGKPIKNLHIIGGGCKNTLLNRYTEEATGVRVIPGPVEATAIGNILIQAQAEKS